ncbi:MAG: POTRA domain-containing protein, partial [Pseudomonadota bacterium]
MVKQLQALQLRKTVRTDLTRVIAAVLLLLTIAAQSEVLPTALTHRFDIAILGTSNDHSRQIRTHVEQLALHDFDDMQARLSAIEIRTRESLQALGYYQPSITTKYATYKQFTAIQLFVEVGKPIVVEEIALNIIGDADHNDEFRRQLGNLPIRTGVYDAKAPAPICISGLSIELMPDGEGGGAMAVWANDF